MKTRDFDPVFSAALRNELEHLADAPEPAAVPVLDRLRRPQVWVTVVTAVVLIATTIGVLRLTAPRAEPAAPGSAVVDPLITITDPNQMSYVARAVDVVLHARGVGTGTHEFDVPPTVTDVRFYLACSPGGGFRIDVDRTKRVLSSGCDRVAGSSGSGPLAPGRHRLTVHVGARTAYAVLAIRTPGPTVSAGPLIDPLQQVRDRRVPDALTGDTRPVLREAGIGERGFTAAVTPGRRLRVFLACTPSSAATQVRIDGHVVSGCMNAIAHWFDFAPAGSTVAAQVTSSGGWSLLVVPAPAGAKDSPANTLLSYPPLDRSDLLLAQARGAGATATGTFAPTKTLRLVMTCRGTGWLEVSAGSLGTSGRGADCGQKAPLTVTFGGEPASTTRERWTATPHGDISWTLQIVAG